MKELSVEQKAQRYDEAYKKVAIRFGSNVADEIFPELKESEDERIRKDMIETIKKESKDFPSSVIAEKSHTWIAWLEKQGEHANFLSKIQVGDKVTRNKDGVLVNLSQLNRVAKKDEKQGKNDIGISEATKQKLEDKLNKALEKETPESLNKFLSEQGEQNPADKIEPKFHKGEWLCENEPNNYARFIQILEIVNVQCKERYRISRDIHNDEDIVEFDFVEKYYHKFGIQDAKDGDVLVMQKTDVTYESIFIFKKIENDCIIQYLHYFITDAGEKVCEARSIDGFLGFVGTTVHPSTKEQRDTLEKAMTDAGCKFDFDKKELKKIVVPKFNVHDCVIKKHNSNINDFGSFTITDITGGKYWYNNRIICDISEQDEWELYEPVRQNTAEWSEEDEIRLKHILRLLDVKDDKKYLLMFGLNSLQNLEKDIAWLKSLRLQKQWKPTEEQIKALEMAVEGNVSQPGIIQSILEQLKEL